MAVMFGDQCNPDFDRHAWIRETHERDWPAECIEVLKVAACYFTNHEISVVLGIPPKRVAMWLDYAVDILFGGWPDTRPADTAAVMWFDEHRLCCTALAHAELEYQHYPEAERWRYEQPPSRKRRIESHQRRTVCSWARPPSERSRFDRTVFRRGCGQYGAIGMEPPGPQSPGAS